MPPLPHTVILEYFSHHKLLRTNSITVVGSYTFLLALLRRRDARPVLLSMACAAIGLAPATNW